MGASKHYSDAIRPMTSDAIKGLMRALTEDRTGDLEAADRELEQVAEAVVAWRASIAVRLSRRREVVRAKLQRAGILSADDA